MRARVEVGQATLAVITSFSFLVGCACSAFAGYIGMWVSVRTSIRVAIAASKTNYPDALLVAFRGGAVSALLSAAMCILGLTTLFLLFSLLFPSLPPAHVPLLLVGYGFGASFVALFMQLGGGIYTKGADVGADMIGKVEAGIPEDDPRNPAVIADLVGDNVGDCAGSMADVFESIAAEIIGTMILGGSLAKTGGILNADAYVFFPLIVHAWDLVVSSCGVLTLSVKGDEDPLASMQRAYYCTMALAAVGFAVSADFRRIVGHDGLIDWM